MLKELPIEKKDDEDKEKTSLANMSENNTKMELTKIVTIKKKPVKLTNMNLDLGLIIEEPNQYLNNKGRSGSTSKTMSCKMLNNHTNRSTDPKMMKSDYKGALEDRKHKKVEIGKQS